MSLVNWKVWRHNARPKRSATGQRSHSASWLGPCAVPSGRRKDAGSEAEGLEDDEDKGEDRDEALERPRALDEDQAGGDKGEDEDLAQPKETWVAGHPKGREGSAKEAEVGCKALGSDGGELGDGP